MPVPSADAGTAEQQENGGASAAPALQFSYVECLLYTFHQLGKRCPEFLSAPENEEVSERMKDFKIRSVCFPECKCEFKRSIFMLERTLFTF